MSTPSYYQLLAFIVAFFITKCHLFAQEPSYIQYSTNNGLPSNTVYYSLQDDKGYIWFGTDKGVSRFNGYGFENYNYKNGLGDNEIFDIYQDSQKRIWFSGYNGKLSFYSNGKFNNVKNNDSLKSVDFKGIGLNVKEDNKGTLYYITNESLYSSSESKPIESSKTSGLYASLAYNEQKEVILVSTLKDVFLVSNLTNKNEISFPKTYQGEKLAPRINSKSIIIKNQLYFNYGNYLVEVDLIKKKYDVIYAFESSEQIQCFFRLSDYLMWVGTQNGLYLFDIQKKKVINRYLKNISVSSIAYDNEENIWVTSLNKGVFQIINKNILFYNSKSGLDFDKCLYLNTIDSSIVIGSYNFMCSFISGNKIINISFPKAQGEGKVESIKKSIDGNILISAGSAFYELDKLLKLKKKHMSAVNDILINDFVTIIAQGFRVLRFENNPYNIEEYLRIDRKFVIPPINIRVKRIFQTKDSTVYLMGSFGALKIEGNMLTQIHPDPILKNNIVDFAETKDGIQWFASSIDGLLAIYNNRAYHFTHYEGLPSDAVSSIAIDNNENVWVGTQNGLCKISYNINQKKGKIKYYNRTSGLANNSINDVLYFNGKIWVATDYGVCAFNENDLTTKSYKPYILVESVFSGEDEIISNNNSFTLSDQNKSLKIKYRGISTSSLSDIKYRYRLNGLTEKWTETKNTEIEYPSIPPGEYKLEIIAINSQNKTSDVLVISFEVIPKFYQTLWFYFVILILTTIIVFVLIRLRIKKINKKHNFNQYLLRLENEKLENEKKQVEFNVHLSELKQKALLLHMNPHFIFNSINAINGFYASGDIDNAKVYVSMFSNLLRSIIDFSQKKFITIREEVELLEQYLKLNQIRFNDKFNFAIEVDTNINKVNSLIPPMIIQPFVENAIIHGIAPLDGGGKILIKIYQEAGFLNCIIEDNGIGLTKSKEINKNRIHNSTGINVSKERIKMFSDTIEEDSFSIVEKIEPETGTIVHFKLKVDNLW